MKPNIIPVHFLRQTRKTDSSPSPAPAAGIGRTLLTFLLLFLLFSLTQAVYALSKAARQGLTYSVRLESYPIGLPEILMVLAFIAAMAILFIRLNDNQRRKPLRQNPAAVHPTERVQKTGPQPAAEIAWQVEAAVLKRLQKFEEEREYLSKDISLLTLAALLDTNPKYATIIILKNRGKTIADYLSHLRLTYVTEQLRTNPKYRSYTQQALSEEAGFSLLAPSGEPLKPGPGSLSLISYSSRRPLLSLTNLILQPMNSNHNLAINTLAGTLLSLSYIAWDDIVKSGLLAAVGATVSLSVSLLLRFLLKKAKQKWQK